MIPISTVQVANLQKNMTDPCCENIASTVDNGTDNNHPVPINIDGKSHEDPDISGISSTTADPDINLKDTSCSHPGHIVMEVQALLYILWLILHHH